MIAPLVTELLVLAALNAPAPPQGESSDGTSAGDVIYYDWLEFEGDRLRGGRIGVEPGNRFHAVVGPFATEAAEPVITLMDNGPPSNRIDLVFVGDGYTASELGAYASDVDGILPVFFAREPFAAYMPFFNVHRVDVTSNESGVDNDPLGVLKDTALDMTFWCSNIQRLLCVDVGKALAKAQSAPDVDQILALANSSTYGGAGYPSSDLGTLAAQNSSAIEIGLHEFGHSLGDLADEYDYGGPTTYTGSEPTEANVSIHDTAAMSSMQTKWHLWFGTPGVDTYEGAFYSQFGVYRPTFDSLMRNLGRPFEEINREQLVFQIYRAVSPIDDATSRDVCDPAATFFVDPVHPFDHALQAQWELDGAPIAGATAETFDASALGLGPGTWTLSVEVVDDTPWVRDEALRDSLLTETRSWTLVVASATSDDPLGTNPSSFTVGGSHGGRPVLGGTLDFAVDVSGTTGHSSSTVVGYLSPLSALLGGGQLLLVNVADPGGELFGFPVQAGDFSATGVPVANSASLCGLTVYAQAIHLGGVMPFALSNRQTLVVGYE